MIVIMVLIALVAVLALFDVAALTLAMRLKRHLAVVDTERSYCAGLAEGRLMLLREVVDAWDRTGDDTAMVPDYERFAATMRQVSDVVRETGSRV